MDSIRVIIAILVFSISSYLVYDLIANGFSWMVLLVCIAGYLSAHYVWPKRHESSAWYDAIELMIDLPFRAIALFFRTIGRLFKSADVDVGVDL